LLKVGAAHAGSQAAELIGRGIAKKLAWEAGKQIIPVAGQISNVITGIKAVECFVECD